MVDTIPNVTKWSSAWLKFQGIKWRNRIRNGVKHLTQHLNQDRHPLNHHGKDLSVARKLMKVDVVVDEMDVVMDNLQVELSDGDNIILFNNFLMK